MTVVQNSQTQPTAIGDKTYPWAMHTAWGALGNFLQNVIETTGAYTYHKKKVQQAQTNYLVGSTASTTSIQTINVGPNPDVPRVLTITIGGNAGDVIAGNIQLIGVNIEGKPITDVVAYTTTGTVTGSLVFKRINTVIFPAQGGTDVTLQVGISNRLGLNHRLVPSYSTIVCISDVNTGTSPGNSLQDLKNIYPIVEAAVVSSNTDNQFVEKNWAQPATAPNGTTFLYFFYWFYKVLVYPPKDSPEFYSTTTSTSTSMSSTSTSVSTSTSISSTSVSSTSSSISSTSSSISSTSASSTSVSTTLSGTTSTSTSSTSTSISSTSTSTTTLPV
jgi:hypothetical protein